MTKRVAGIMELPRCPELAVRGSCDEETPPLELDLHAVSGIEDGSHFDELISEESEIYKAPRELSTGAAVWMLTRNLGHLTLSHTTDICLRKHATVDVHNLCNAPSCQFLNFASMAQK